MHRFLMLIVILALVACGEKSGNDADGAEDGCGCACGCEAEEEEEDEEDAPTTGTATVKGVVKWEGEPPRRRKIDMGTDKYCVNCHPEGAMSETVVVGPEGGLANVFVQVKSGLKGRYSAPSAAVKLDQEGCTYIPHVVGIMVKQTLAIHNSDTTMHNIHAVDQKTRRDLFNFAQSKKGAVSEKSFRRAGVVDVKCDVHGWMKSYIHVVKHPFYGVTGGDGAFSLDKLPAGTYTIEAWHEKYGTQTKSVTVADGAAVEVSFTFRKS